MAFFLQRRIQPLQHCFSKLWSYSGSEDSSRVSEEDIDKKDLDKRVRALTTLTKDDEIPVLMIRLKRIYNFWCSMLVYTPFA
jgi:hypothetical protein